MAEAGPADVGAHLARMERDGWTVITGAVEAGLVDALAEDLARLERDLGGGVAQGPKQASCWWGPPRAARSLWRYVAPPLHHR